MSALVELYLAHPFWAWTAAAAVFLAVEVATGTTYLLWPAGAAAVTAVLVAARLPLPPGADAGVFAALTIATTLAGRRYVRRKHGESDINDPARRLIGRRGAAATGFRHGQGRVLVDGKEWAAELDGEAELAKEAPVEVAEVLDGGRLKVRPL